MSGRCFGWLIVDPIKVVLKSQLGSISRGAMQLYFVKNCLDFVSTKIIVESSEARFIWNAEISVSVAIHCYKRLF